MDKLWVCTNSPCQWLHYLTFWLAPAIHSLTFAERFRSVASTTVFSSLPFLYVVLQRAIDEVDYAVKNIAIDLRDGLRLTWVALLFTDVVLCSEWCTVNRPKSLMTLIPAALTDNCKDFSIWTGVFWRESQYNSPRLTNPQHIIHMRLKFALYDWCK